MTPAARVAAAIEVIDIILDGAAPEKALTGWGRSHRFAGSKDRAAIRDHVFGALRRRASFGWLGGAQTGRGIMLGAMRAAGAEMFSGVGHAPAPVVDGEEGQPLDTAPRDVRLDMPDWLLSHFDAALGGDADKVLSSLQSRAGVFLRVNIARCTVQDAAAMLAEEDIKCAGVDDVKTALQVIENERRVAMSRAYLDGLVELQDPSSQAAILALPLSPDMRALDFCAGGGGKALAMAVLCADVTAHDIEPRRMIDVAPRAARAGVIIETMTTGMLADCAPFDLVLCDAPCSGSGTWRRTPAAKWELTPDRLTELTEMQDDVLRKAAPLVKPDGFLAYATCSVFDVENSARIQSFMSEQSDFVEVTSLVIQPHAQGDGFYLCVLQRNP